MFLTGYCITEQVTMSSTSTEQSEQRKFQSNSQEIVLSPEQSLLSLAQSKEPAVLDLTSTTRIF